MVAVPTTRTRLSHALRIRSGGRTIGAIRSWSFSQGREIDTEWEIEPNAVGMPVDLVPQTVSRRELRIGRYDLYPAIMEEVFGTSEIVVLTDQYRPFSLREIWYGPSTSAASTLASAVNALGTAANIAGTTGLTAVASGIQNAQAATANAIAAASASSLVAQGISAQQNTVQRPYEIQGCFFADVGRQIDATGDRAVYTEATLIWMSRVALR